MNQWVRSYLWMVLLWMVMCINSGCNVVGKTPTPSPASLISVSGTATPIVQSVESIIPVPAHYTPSDHFNVGLEFDYPNTWTLTEKMQGDSMVIGLGDPQALNLPPGTPSDLHPAPNDYGNIEIWVSKASPDRSLNIVLAAHEKGYSEMFYVKALNQYETQVDGHPAYVFEDQIDLPDIYSSLMFERNVFFAVDDQIYQITFLVAEKDRDGAFEDGYEYFFQSLKIVP